MAYMSIGALTLLVGRQEGHPVCKKTEWWSASMVICLERGADLHLAQLMPLPLTVCWFSKIQIGFTFLVPAHPSSPGQSAVKRECVCVSRYVRGGVSGDVDQRGRDEADVRASSPDVHRHVSSGLDALWT